MSHQEAPTFAGSYGYRCKGSGLLYHKGPLTTGEDRPFLKNNNEQSNSQAASHATHDCGSRQKRAHSLESLSGPTSSRPLAPLGRTSVSLKSQGA
jgi:hypothetical protein